jgi:hypothetical protein
LALTTPETQSFLEQGAREVDPEATGGLTGIAPAPTSAPDNPELQGPSALQSSIANYDARKDSLFEAAKVGGAQLVNQALFGVPELVYDHFASDKDRADWEAEKGRHELANYGAGAAGFGLSFLVGAPLFRVAAKAGQAAHALVAGTAAAEDVARAADAADAVTRAVRASTSGMRGGETGAAAEHLASTALAPQVAEEALPRAQESLIKQFPEHASDIKGALQVATDAATEHVADVAANPGYAGAVPSGMGMVRAGDTALGTSLRYAEPAEVASRVASGIDTVKLANVAGDAVAQAAPSLPRALAAKVAQYAVEGAVLSSPATIANAAMGDFKQAGESLLWGTGLNVGLGGVGDLIGQGADRLASALPNGLQKTIEGLQQRMALRALNVPKSAAKKMGEGRLKAMADWAADSGLLGKASTKEDLASLVEEAHGQAGKDVGQALEALDGANAQSGAPYQIDASQLKEGIRDRLKGALQDKFGVNAAEKAEAEKLVDAVDGLPQSPTLKDVQELKEALGAKARFDQTASKGTNDVRKDAYGEVKRFQEQQADAMSQSLGDGELSDKWKRAKKDFGAASDAMRGTDELRAQQAGNRIFGLSDSVAAQFSASGFLHAVAGGHPLAAAGAIGTFMAKKWAENRGMLVGSRLLRQLARQPEGGAFGLMLASDAQKAMKQRIQQFQMRTASGAASAGGSKKAEPMTQERFQKVSRQLSWATASPEGQQHAVQAAAVFHGAPNAAIAYHQAMQRAVGWLNTQLPRAPNAGDPFAPAWQPSPGQLRSFGDKEEIASDPMRVEAHVKDGTLTADHVAALQNCFPEMYAAIVAKAQQQALSDPGSQTPATRATMLTLLGHGTPTYPGPGPSAPPPQAQAEAKSKGGQAKAVSFDKMPSDATESQQAGDRSR